MNVLGYRFRDDISTKLAAFERTVHDYENQSTKTVDDDIKIGVTMLGMEDMRVEEHLIRNTVRISSWNQMRGDSRDHANTTVHRQSTDAIAARSEFEEQRQGQRKDKAKDAKNESYKKAKIDDQRKCYYCQETGHVKAECLLLGERHTSTFVIAMPCANSETSCESSSERAVRSPGAGSFTPAETQRVRTIAAIPSNEPYLMMDTCAGASICPRGFDQSTTDELTVAPARFLTATDDPVHGDAGKKS